uniref:Sodium/hydrogen exchanger n=2 Tax=Panagrolaimus sp. PS1159 TaxID=55785 RepID=A0AC35F8Q9_9BILA
MNRLYLAIFVFLSISFSFGNIEEEESSSKRFEIISFEWHSVETAYTVSIWILLASVAKILFHVNKKFGDALPDSACLIVVGLLLGEVLKNFNVEASYFSLESHTFFLYLLPPIIFDAGYFMPNRQLFENIDSVMVFAFIGTIFNTVAIAITLFVCGSYGLFSIEFSLFEILLFAALISAVDPVAVIAVFEEIHVNEFLFINVFGEALFNDGAAIVLYLMFKKFNDIGEENMTFIDYSAGGLSFFVIALGGVFIGICFAFIASFVTKYTDRVKALAPVFIFVIPYLSYLTAEMFQVSSILAIVSCGIAMKEYVKGNLSYEANTAVKYFVKMLALCSETIIFMFLGLSTVSSNHHWDTYFIVITIASCLFYRTFGIIIECTVLNRFRTKKFTALDQFVLSYGGLRGAIAFGLAVSMPEMIAAKSMFLTTTIIVIFFTVFIQGISIRSLLNWLKVEKAEEHEISLIQNVYNRYFDYTMAGIEDIIGVHGKNTVRDNFETFNAKVLKPILMKSYQKRHFDASQIIRAYTKVIVQDAMNVAPSRKSSRKEKVDPMALEMKAPEKNPTIVADEEFRVDALYKMFNTLLDSKVKEIENALKERQEIQTMLPKTDIDDDYMAIMRSPDNTLRSNTAIYKRSISNPNMLNNNNLPGNNV